MHCRSQLVGALLLLLLGLNANASPAPRNVYIRGKEFILRETGQPIVMQGLNVVVKGPPWIPSVDGNTRCQDGLTDLCKANGNCTSCTTFNEADVEHYKNMSWDTIRLGVPWAGAQPRDEDALDPDFLHRLHAFLNLTDKAGLHVVLDNHGDMVGSLNCGWGTPHWIQEKAAPQLVGKPLATTLQFNTVDTLRINPTLPKYAYCANNETKWMEHAGDPYYYLKNGCCKKINEGSNQKPVGFSTMGQLTMTYIIKEGEGRNYFTRFWRLMAEAVADHPSAFAAELMNEPISIERPLMYQTWRAAAEVINSVIPDMAVSVQDTAEGAVTPYWLGDAGWVDLDAATLAWMRESKNLFYAWHWYKDPVSPADGVRNAQAVSDSMNMPNFLTEFRECSAWATARAAGISVNYWHYSVYCTTGPYFGDMSAPEDTFGGCVLGWEGGDHDIVCDVPPVSFVDTSEPYLWAIGIGAGVTAIFCCSVVLCVLVPRAKRQRAMAAAVNRMGRARAKSANSTATTAAPCSADTSVADGSRSGAPSSDEASADDRA